MAPREMMAFAYPTSFYGQTDLAGLQGDEEGTEYGQLIRLVETFSESARFRPIYVFETLSEKRDAARITPAALTSNLHLTDSVERHIKGLDESFRAQGEAALRLLDRIKWYVLSDSAIRESVPLAQLHCVTLDDGDLVLEWAYPEGRVEFYFDSDPADSLAVFVAKDQEGAIVSSKIMLTSENIDRVARESVLFCAGLV